LSRTPLQCHIDIILKWLLATSRPDDKVAEIGSIDVGFVENLHLVVVLDRQLNPPEH